MNGSIYTWCRVLRHIRLIIVLGWMVCGGRSYAQSNGGARYSVVDFSTGTGLSWDELNRRVGKATTDEELIGVLRVAFASTKEGFALYTKNTPAGKETYRYWVASGRVGRADLTTLASRGDLLDQVTTLQELDSLFHDTLAVIGDLAVRLAIPQYPARTGEWQLYWAEPGGDAFTAVELPVRGDTIFLPRSFFPDGSPLVEVVLRNAKAPGSNLGHCWVRFLSATQQRELRSVMCEEDRSHPERSRKMKLTACDKLLRTVYGHGHGPNLAPLLCR